MIILISLFIVKHYIHFILNYKLHNIIYLWIKKSLNNCFSYKLIVYNYFFANYINHIFFMNLTYVFNIFLESVFLHIWLLFCSNKFKPRGTRNGTQRSRKKRNRSLSCPEIRSTKRIAHGIMHEVETNDRSLNTRYGRAFAQVIK